MPKLSGYVLETLWEDGDFVLSRGVRDGEPCPLLAVAPRVDAALAGEPHAAGARLFSAGPILLLE